MLSPFIISNFYKFVDLPNHQGLQSEIKGFCKNNKLLGTVILAHEGINASICGFRNNIYKFYQFIEQYPEFKEIKFQENPCNFIPFKRLRVRIKKEIVVFRNYGLDTKIRGIHISPQEWGELISSNNAILIDTRNKYEYAMGTFKNAINPNTENFSDLKQWLDDNLSIIDSEQPIAMFCTGGIRCEKSTAYLKSQGFKNIYQLEGGILNYLTQMRQQEYLWQGSCFVFDDRKSVDKNLQPIVEYGDF